MGLLVFVKEGKGKRILDICFLVIPCERVCNIILGRSFLATLDGVTSTFHLKMKYHNDWGELIVISDDLYQAVLIHETILKTP